MLKLQLNALIVRARVKQSQQKSLSPSAPPLSLFCKLLICEEHLLTVQNLCLSETETKTTNDRLMSVGKRGVEVRKVRVGSSDGLIVVLTALRKTTTAIRSSLKALRGKAPNGEVLRHVNNGVVPKHWRL